MTNLDNDPERLRRRVTAAETLIISLHGEIEQYRAALELIAGSSADKLQAIQARSALDNIGPKS